MVLEGLSLLEEDEEIQRIDKQILEQKDQNTWNVYVEGNTERSMEVNFEKILANINKEYSIDTENLTVWRFFAILEDIKERNNKQNP